VSISSHNSTPKYRSYAYFIRLPFAKLDPLTDNYNDNYCYPR